MQGWPSNYLMRRPVVHARYLDGVIAVRRDQKCARREKKTTEMAETAGEGGWWLLLPLCWKDGACGEIGMMMIRMMMMMVICATGRRVTPS